VTAKPERVEWVPLVSARDFGMTQVWALVWVAQPFKGCDELAGEVEGFSP